MFAAICREERTCEKYRAADDPKTLNRIFRHQASVLGCSPLARPSSQTSGTAERSHPR